MSDLRLLGTVAAALALSLLTGSNRPLLARSATRSSAMPSTSVPAASIDQNQCKKCHAEEVAGFARSKMAHSMRVGGQEPAGVVTAPGTTITMHSDKAGSWQTLNSHGTTTTYHVDYVIGSGTHASGYIMDLGDHLFQSPVAYYLSRSAYGLAPGYEDKPDPDFTRPIATGCVFCHAGSFDAVDGSQNRYASLPFPHLAISCNRCHGPLAAHLAKPGPGNIVNPADLEPAARDSVCEQCHLIGVARILNPGKKFTDFTAGKPLEETFTIYHNQSPKGTEAVFKVISHSEQLALSKCARSSGGRMWCGTCHNPHNEPTEPISYYRGRCMLCHSKTTFASGHPDRTSNCIGCHMTRREAGDGGHSAFTDHRIQRRPQQTVAEGSETVPAIVPWRQPPVEFATRNLGIALTEYGLAQRSPKQILSGYRTLTTVQQQFPQDSELYNMLGTALITGKQYGEAVQAFTLAVRFDPISSPKEASLGQAYMAAGQEALGEQHLERAMELDPLNLSAAALLIDAYDKNGTPSKSDQLSQKISKLVQSKSRGQK
ncbi:MAG: tetratricopeptide repeat protein [Edaphobacter sp.]|nr:tetratricopeptide repeat protein [Edaphobacter sp.]